MNSQSWTFGVGTLSGRAIRNHYLLRNLPLDFFCYKPIKFFILRAYNTIPMEIIESVNEFVTKYVALNEEEIAMIAQSMVIREFGKKEQPTKEGEVEGYLNFVAKGLARKYFLKKKEEMVTHIAKEGEIICCYESFVSGTPSSFIV